MPPSSSKTPLADSFAGRVLQTIVDHRLTRPGETVVAAVSGGADSLALVAVLQELQPILEIDLRAGHVNHGLRGDESEQDQAFVEEVCRKLGIPLSCERREPGAEGNLEERARELRYDFLAELASRMAQGVVATGHHRDDQVETFLLKLFRGSGLTGLSGIRISRTHRRHEQTVRVTRPLLECSRIEILDYLSERGLSYRTDRTNLQLDFSRNWLRHDLIPRLEARLNPSLSETLARNARLLDEVDDYLRSEAERALKRFALESSDHCILPLKELKELPAALQKMVVRQALSRFCGLKEISFRHTESILELAEKGSGRRIDLPGALRAVREFDSLRLTTEEPPPGFEQILEIPGSARICPVQKTVRVECHPRGAHQIVGRQLRIRNRRPGDRYRLPGGEKKLKKIFSEERIPLTQRDRLLVFEDALGICWVEGLPPQERSLTDESGSVSYVIEVSNETF